MKITKDEFIDRVLAHPEIAHLENHRFWHYGNGYLEPERGNNWRYVSGNATEHDYIIKDELVREHIWNKRMSVWKAYTGEWYAKNYIK